MLYIITEDTNSARAFWKEVAEVFRGNGNYTLVPLPKGKDNKDSGGNTTLKNQINYMMSYAKAQDELLIAFDNISNANNFNTTKFIKWAINKCKVNNISVKFTSYYCFEELYLSYYELIDMYKKCNYKEVVLKALEFTNKSIMNRIDYFDKSVSEVANFIQYYKNDSGKNREHFANALLLEVTKTIGDRFKITKSGDCFDTSGMCWLKSCTDIQDKMHPKEKINLCDIRCKYKCKNAYLRNKIIDLDKRSMTSNCTFKLKDI